MVLFEDKKKCCGCGACSVVCPRNAITMVEDEHGYVYPEINNEQCVDCGACKNICSFQEPKDFCTTINSYAVAAKDDVAIMNSASGGAFIALATQIINMGGVVYGCAMEKENNIFVIKNKRAEKLEELKKFQGSKYVQSSITEIFPLIRNDLMKGIKVLFSGTPCQNAALKKFLRKEYNNLYTVEIICHGVPNQKLFNDFISHYEKQLNGTIKEFYFRDKSKGQGYITRTVYADKNGQIRQKIKKGELFAYIRFFSKSLTLRENCYECPYAGKNRAADLTIGDFWGFNEVHSNEAASAKLTTQKGISCVLINSEKGQELFAKCRGDFEYIESSFEKVQKYNEQLKTPTRMPEKRKLVLETYSANGYDGLEKYYWKNFMTDKFKYKIADLMPRDLKTNIRKTINRIKCK